jgi:hypothetical protein
MTAPVAVRSVRHQCPHCRRTWARRAAAVAHVARCWRNPEARGCLTCAHFEPFEEGPYEKHPGFPESCGAGRDITTGLVTGCPDHTLTAEEPRP